jgi:hypothetical protein
VLVLLLLSLLSLSCVVVVECGANQLEVPVPLLVTFAMFRKNWEVCQAAWSIQVLQHSLSGRVPGSLVYLSVPALRAGKQTRSNYLAAFKLSQSARHSSISCRCQSNEEFE